ncbi:hypothetical protein BC828DRAFT_388720 [Blastocladiella britannica]|nr:hypothetical protein BC828DRAFT_388720 [Blastocladiella britannica]
MTSKTAAIKRRRIDNFFDLDALDALETVAAAPSPAPVVISAPVPPPKRRRINDFSPECLEPAPPPLVAPQEQQQQQQQRSRRTLHPSNGNTKVTANGKPVVANGSLPVVPPAAAASTTTKSKTTLATTTSMAAARKSRQSGGDDLRRKSLSRRSISIKSPKYATRLVEPHASIDPATFHRHLPADLPPPKRMFHLLLWSGARVLKDRVAPRVARKRDAHIRTAAAAADLARGGSAGVAPNAAPARADESTNLEEFLIKKAAADFTFDIIKGIAHSANEFNWVHRRTDAVPPPPARKLKDNPVNVRNRERLRVLDAEIAIIKSQREEWKRANSVAMSAHAAAVDVASAPPLPMRESDLASALTSEELALFHGTDAIAALDRDVNTGAAMLDAVGALETATDAVRTLAVAQGVAADRRRASDLALANAIARKFPVTPAPLTLPVLEGLVCAWRGGERAA